MSRERPVLACVVFAIAGGCGWFAMNVSPYWIWTIGLWFGAWAFAGLGFGILMGKVGRKREDPPWPDPFDPTSNPYPGTTVQPYEGQYPTPQYSTPQWIANPLPIAPAPRDDGAGSTVARAPQPGETSEHLADAVFHSGKRIVGGMRLVMMVLSLLIVVPLLLMLGLSTVFAFLGGDIESGIGGIVLCAILGGYCWYLLRKRQWIPFIGG